jgi:hypothetical protein
MPAAAEALERRQIGDENSIAHNSAIDFIVDKRWLKTEFG